MLRAASLSLVSRSMWRASPAFWMFVMTPNKHSSLSATGWSCGGPTKAGPTNAAGAIPEVGLRAPPGTHQAVLHKDGRHSRETPGMGASQPLGVLLLGGQPEFPLAGDGAAPRCSRVPCGHELAHLKHRNHTKEFWGEVEKAYPQWQSAAEWLRGNGAGRTL